MINYYFLVKFNDNTKRTYVIRSYMPYLAWIKLLIELRETMTGVEVKSIKVRWQS